MEMKMDKAKYLLSEGISNINRNKLMSFASVTIVAATLIVFGIFYISIVNISSNMRIIKDEPELYIECFPNADEKTVNDVEKYLAKNNKIERYEKFTKADALAKLKEMLGKDTSMIEGLNEDFLPVSFKIKLIDPLQSRDLAAELGKLTGVEIVEYSGDTISFRVKVISWIQIASAIMIIILMLNSLLVISNTIKLTVYARRKEIGIMKYIGATDWFIRWPFFIEGALIGIIGAVVSFITIIYLYTKILGKFNFDMRLIGTQIFNTFTLVPVNHISLKLLFSYAIIGISVGILGSYISLRKHLIE